MKEVMYYRNGLSYRTLDEQMSIETSRGGVEEHCWYNALFVLLAHDIDAMYIEGFQLYDNENGGSNLWNHGWLEKNGVIIDPYPNIKWEEVQCVYFPVARYSKSEANKLLQTAPPPYSNRLSSPHYKKHIRTLETANRFMSGKR